jgi:Novel STAND NTPase 1
MVLFGALKALTEIDEALLRGREAVVGEIVQNCRGGRLTVVTAEAGMGISSLLKAGVGPALKNEGFIVATFRDWQGRLFGTNLKEAVSKAVRAAADDLFFQEGEELAELLERAHGRTGKPVVLLLDQFEDYLRCHTNTIQSDLFDAELAHAVADRKGIFVLGLQEHAIPSFERLEAHIPNLLGFRVCLEPLSIDAAREAVESEASMREMQVEPAALDALLNAPVVSGALVKGIPLADAKGAPSNGARALGAARRRVPRARGAHPFYLKLATEELLEAEARAKSRMLTFSAIEFRGGVDRVVFESFDPVIQELGKTRADLFFQWCKILISPDMRRLSVTEKGLTKYAGRLNRSVPALLTHLMEMKILRSVETPEAVRYEISRECYAPILRDWWERREATIVARRRAVFRITSISVALGAIAIVYLMWLIFSPK